MSKSRYNWYMLKKTLVNNFNIIARWTYVDTLEFSGPHGRVVLVKDNNISEEYVMLMLQKLHITIEEFEKAYRNQKAQK